MPSIFGNRKPAARQSQGDTLQRLRETLEKLESESDDTPRIATLKRILAARIQELRAKRRSTTSREDDRSAYRSSSILTLLSRRAPMLILTTIYFSELKNFDPRQPEQKILPLEPSAAKSRELVRELLSLYEGKNRVMPLE